MSSGHRELAPTREPNVLDATLGDSSFALYKCAHFKFVSVLFIVSFHSRAEQVNNTARLYNKIFRYTMKQNTLT